MKTKLTPISTVLLAGTLISRIAMFMSVPFLSIYLTNALHFTVVQAGYIIGMNPLVVVISSFFAGKISEYIQPKALLTVVPFLWGITWMSFNFTSSYLLLLILNGLNGLFYALYEPNTKNVLSSVTGQEDKRIIFNIRYAAINIGTFLGPLLGNIFNVKSNLFSYVLLGIVYCGLSVANLLAFRNYSPKLGNTKKAEQPKGNISFPHLAPFLLLLIGIGFSYFSYSQVTSTVSEYFSNSGRFTNGVHLYSLTISFESIFILVFQILVLRFTKNVSPYKVLIASNLLLGLSLVLATNAYYPVLWLLMVITYSLGELLMGSHLDYTVEGIATEENKTIYFSLTELIKIGSISGPIIGSYLVSTIGFAHAPQLFSTLALISFAGSFIIGLAAKRLTVAKDPSLETVAEQEE